MRPHEKLDVWRKAIEFVLAVYKATESFPKEEKFGLTSQVRRAAVSIPANLAEGAARSSRKEFAHFISNAQGSASEAETELLIAHRLSYLSEKQYASLQVAQDDLGKMLNGLARHVQQRIRAGT
jgi:four helix bundle protein